MTINQIRRGIAEAALRADRIEAAYPYRPARFHMAPLVYVDIPDIERTAMKSGSGLKPVTLEVPAVLIVTGTWDEAAQSVLDDLTELLWTELERDRTLDGTCESAYVARVRALRPRQATQEDDGLPVGPVGAVFEMQIQAKL